MSPSQYDKARAWRESIGLTQAELGEAIGYARETIYWMERGKTPQGRAGNVKPGKIKEWVWQRYKMACAGYQAQLNYKQEFDWE